MSVLNLDYDGLKALSKRRGIAVKDLIVNFDNDPFYAGSPARRAWAEWFAEIWERFDFQLGVHLRRIHYVLVSTKKPILDINGKRYVNRFNCWQDLKTASRDARYLDLVPMDAFEDHRSDPPVICLINGELDAELTVEEPYLADVPSLVEVPTWLPDPPSYELSSAVIDQRYHLEIWAEKTSVEDVLMPLARQYGLNLLMGAGDLSLIHCNNFLKRAIASERPCRIAWISDFDPKGRNMPSASARKVEFLIRTHHPDLDVQIMPVALTHEQTIEHRLPRIPLKDSDKGKEGFEERFGAGATEVEALEALRPGVLRKILLAWISRYHDRSLSSRVADVAEDFREELREVHTDVLERHEAELDALRDEQLDIAEKCNAELAPIIDRYRSSLQEIADRFNSHQGTIARELGEEAPDLDEIEWPKPAEGDEEDDPLFDSTRDYLDQLERFQEH